MRLPAEQVGLALLGAIRSGPARVCPISVASVLPMMVSKQPAYWR